MLSGDWELVVFRILRREELDEGILILNEIQAPAIADKAKRGDLVVLKANEQAECIQLPVADIDRSKGSVTIIYMVLCQSTATFKALQEGEAIKGMIGPFSLADPIKMHDTSG
jgi:ferredoxin--NADP+ reductase